jgi:hypothetical protein
MITKQDYITFETKKNGNISMNRDTFVRWLCLVEGFDFIDRKAEELGFDMSKEDWLKPLAFEKYVKERFEGMSLDLAFDEKNNLIGDTFVSYKQPAKVLTQ